MALLHSQVSPSIFSVPKHQSVFFPPEPNQHRRRGGTRGPSAVQSERAAVCFTCCCSFCLVSAQQWGKAVFVASAAGGRVGGRGYVPPLSGLLTGFPPFMTTGSQVVLLEGGTPASLGTASPTSCNDGSRYMATEGMKRHA